MTPEAEQFEILKRLQKLRDELRKQYSLDQPDPRREILANTLRQVESAFQTMRPIIDQPDFTPKE